MQYLACCARQEQLWHWASPDCILHVYHALILYMHACVPFGSRHLLSRLWSSLKLPDAV